jgi:AefR-like transcriptional repressor, C-terminal domain
LRKALLEVAMPGLLDRTARYLRAIADQGALTIGDSPEAVRLAASRFIALVQGQLVFSAACGGEVSARTRSNHVNDAVKAFVEMYG